jgi:hypothetical protein
LLMEHNTDPTSNNTRFLNFWITVQIGQPIKTCMTKASAWATTHSLEERRECQSARRCADALFQWSARGGCSQGLHSCTATASQQKLQVVGHVGQSQTRSPSSRRQRGCIGDRTPDDRRTISSYLAMPSFCRLRLANLLVPPCIRHRHIASTHVGVTTGPFMSWRCMPLIFPTNREI